MPAVACLADDALPPPGFGDVSLPLQVPYLVDSEISSTEVPTWSPLLSASLYRIDAWGAPYFVVNSSGNISVRPHGEHTLPYQEIDLMKIMKKASDTKDAGGLGLRLPLIIRLPDVLKHQIEYLNLAFESAVRNQSYESHYQGVYPVKCNQDRFIVEDVVKFGYPFRFGLEAGSKPELLLAMSSLCNGNPDALLVCNGFKDTEYISLALIARKLELNTVIVLEQEEEVNLVIDLSLVLNVVPVIGLRAKLRTKHAGHFGSTSGEKGKFGLTTREILRVVTKLEQAGMLECLQLLHFHIGSQIPTTDLLSDGVSEAAQIYCELVRLGAKMKIIDIGGGLGVDYDGSKSSDSEVSIAYGFEEYAMAVVESVKRVCDRKFVEHPILCSESGRAIVSHHSILIFEAISETDRDVISSFDLKGFTDGLSGEAVSDYENLREAAGVGDYKLCVVLADLLKQRCVELFKGGDLSMENLAAADALCELVSDVDCVKNYQVNLSVFTSVPDFWGIGQVFPIVPIHRLNERPVCRGVLSDLTCDSDGKIDRFIGGESSLPLHAMEGGGSYYLGMFLGGAYEEALGGLHNLFGSPSVVRVCASDCPSGFCVASATDGLSCGDVLRAMRHEPEVMLEGLRHRVGVGEGSAGSLEGMETISRLLGGSPYLALASSSLCCFEASSAGGFFHYGNENLCGSAIADPAAAEEEAWSYCYA